MAPSEKASNRILLFGTVTGGHGLLFSIYRHREFILAMAVRDLRALNAGAYLGTVWLVLSPLIKVAAYVLVVSLIFRQRLGPNSGVFEYALYVLSGMIPWQLMTKVIEESPSLIRDRQELVKQVIYPIETLPISGMIVSCCGVFVSFIVFFIMSMATGRMKPSWLLLPIPVLLLFVFLVGVSWVFSIAGVIIKDLREIVSVFLSLMVYVSPVLLNESIVGERIWRFVLLNPLAHVVICFRNVFDGNFNPVSWAVFTTISVIALLTGSAVMGRAKTLINEYI